MPVLLVRDDITRMKCDAIVNAANGTLLGGGGVDGAIHKAAGRGLYLECLRLGGCRTGEAKITGAYNLPCRYVIHTVGPKWRGGGAGERELLQSCYKNSLSLAAEHGCGTVAFPLISAGVYGYPRDQALKVAVDTTKEYLESHGDSMTVYVVIFDRRSYEITAGIYPDIKAYIDDIYADAHTDRRRRDYQMTLTTESSFFAAAVVAPNPAKRVPDDKASLAALVADLDESFSEMLLRKIDERGMTDSQCYKKANIDRKLFSKIRSDRSYKPSKGTALAFAIALELPLAEARDMLEKAGYALSHSSKADIIVEYFIMNGRYDMFEINEALFAFDQPLIGV